MTPAATAAGGPQITDAQYGPEPTLRQIVRAYYASHGIADPDATTDAYFAALTPPLAMPGREEVARAIYQTEYPTAHGHPTWDDWVAYAETHRGHQPSVDLVRKQADRILSLFATPEGGTTTDAVLKDAVTELLSHRGERPYRVLRGGQELWETWLPAFRAALRYLPTPAASAPSQDDVSALREAKVAIWSGEHRAYWQRVSRSKGAGYTLNTDKAGVWTRAEAISLTRHCGPEKLIALHDRPTLAALKHKGAGK